MGLLNVIRTLRLRHGLAIREIARRTGLSRNTIKKHLKAGTVEPQFATPERQSKIAPFADKLAGWLKTEAGKSRKQRRTVKQLHADLVALGFTGSYARVSASQACGSTAFSLAVSIRVYAMAAALPPASEPTKR